MWTAHLECELILPLKILSTLRSFSVKIIVLMKNVKFRCKSMNSAAWLGSKFCRSQKTVGPTSTCDIRSVDTIRQSLLMVSDCCHSNLMEFSILLLKIGIGASSTNSKYIAVTVL